MYACNVYDRSLLLDRYMDAIDAYRKTVSNAVANPTRWNADIAAVDAKRRIVVDARNALTVPDLDRLERWMDFVGTTFDHVPGFVNNWKILKDKAERELTEEGRKRVGMTGFDLPGSIEKVDVLLESIGRPPENQPFPLLAIHDAMRESSELAHPIALAVHHVRRLESIGGLPSSDGPVEIPV